MSKEIDEKTQNELSDKYNPEGSLLRKSQLKMLGILLEFDSICSKHGIDYWLSSGTLLGAVRHKGFIPWDDDLDVEMMHEDYLRLISILEKELPSYFAIQNHKTDHFYYGPYSKIRDLKSIIYEHNGHDLYYKYRGLYIDVFHLEPSFRFLMVLSRYMHAGIYRIQKWKPICLSHVIVEVLFFINTKFFYPLFRFLSRNKTNDILYQTYGSGFLRHRESKDIFPLTKIEFEGYLFNAPCNYCHYLNLIFGDFMKLPNQENILSHLRVEKL